MKFEKTNLVSGSIKGLTLPASDSIPEEQGSVILRQGGIQRSLGNGNVKSMPVKLNSLFAMTSHTFTNAGSVGRAGPSLAQCRNAYNTDWSSNAEFFTVESGIQIWTVPKTGLYRIEIAGASGDIVNSNGELGLGAKIAGSFYLQIGEKLRLLVGQKGQGLAGGGGSFVVPYSSTTPLIVAGGGGSQIIRGGFSDTELNAQSSPEGGLVPYGTRASSGEGGKLSSRTSNDGAGGGLLVDGEGGTRGGKAFINGGFGGNGQYVGGFGGGGARGGSWGAGAGGGYSGGGAWGTSDDGSYGGAGGGSFNAGSNQSTFTLYVKGDGFIKITELE